MKTAIISGISGQDASYLAELLLDKGYKVIGTSRRNAERTFSRIKDFKGRLEIVDVDLNESQAMEQLIRDTQADEFYNLAGQTFVADSFKNPFYTVQTNGLAVLNILEAIRRFSPQTKLYQASTSEMFGQVKEIPQTEGTPFNPSSPYGSAKLLAHNLCEIYRHSYGLFVCCGIFFNHESNRRGDEFVTKKITNFVRKYEDQLAFSSYDNIPLQLGNIYSKRDWGYAGDYVEAMWKMMQQKRPDTYVISTGETHTVKEFVNEAFKNIGITLKWRGKGINEKAYDGKDIVVEISKDFYRPFDVEFLLGNSKKAKNILKWKPKHDWKALCKIMIDGE